ncbi:MAG TPA: hypothetical protein VFX02_09195 [Gammaproteobacteria bacterium]|nr:hypothetical protein [Gammaproteobacteria bacterium]
MEKFHTIAISAVITLALGTGVVAENMSKDDYKAALDRIETTYRADKRRCGSMSGNTKDICNAEASGREKIAKADLEVRHNPTPELRREALMVKAEADYETAMEKCDDKAGSMKEVCEKEAEAARTSAEAEAGSEFQAATYENAEELASVGADAYGEPAAEASDARRQPAQPKCTEFEGPARQRCLDSKGTQHDK